MTQSHMTQPHDTKLYGTIGKNTSSAGNNSCNNTRKSPIIYVSSHTVLLVLPAMWLYHRTTIGTPSQSVFNRSVFNRSVFNRSVFNRSVFNRSVFNRSVFNRSVFNRSVFNRSVFNRSVFNRSVFNRSVFNRYLVLMRWLS